MAKLYFYYAAMNAGKSTILLQAAYNYRERGMKALLLTPDVNKRDDPGMIVSRIGLKSKARIFNQQSDFFEYIKNENVDCVLIDEAQFLTRLQVLQLCRIVDELNIPVMTYGLRSDFRAESFEGSKYLLILADQLIELKTICFCGKKAIMNARLNEQGKMTQEGEQVLIGGNERYISLCRKHYFEKLNVRNQ